MMSGILIKVPVPVFYNTDGEPLENGYVFIGEYGLNPEISPINIYSDIDLATPFQQPVRTLAGYPVVSGNPVNIFTNSAQYSITVRDKNSNLIYSDLYKSETITIWHIDTVDDFADVPSGITTVIVKDENRGGLFNRNALGLTADGGTRFIAGGYVWVRQYDGVKQIKWWGAKGDGVTDDSDAIEAWINTLVFFDSGFSASLANFGEENSICFPDGVYRITRPLSIASTDQYIRLSFKMGANAVIKADSFADSDDFALTIKSPFGCYFENLQVIGVGCNGLNIIESRNSSYNNIGAGSDNVYSLKLNGVFFNNTVSNLRLNQNMSINGADHAFYWDVETIDSETVIDGAGAPINKFTGFYAAGADNLITIVGNKNKNVDTWSSGAIEFDTLELEGFNVSAIDVSEIDRQITFKNAWTEGTGTADYEVSFKNCTQVSLENIFFGSSTSIPYFEGCNRISIDTCYAGGLPVFEGKNGMLKIENSTFNSDYSRILQRANTSIMNVPLDLAVFDDVVLNNVEIQSINAASIETATYNNTTKQVAITTSGTTNIDSNSEQVYVNFLIATYTDTDSVAKEINLNGVYTISSFTDVDDFSIYVDVPKYASGFTFVDGIIREFIIEHTTTKEKAYNYTFLPAPRAIGASTRCDVTNSATYDEISPLGIKESLITVNSNSNFPLVLLTIDASSLPADVEEDYILTTCFREKLPTPSTVISEIDYIRTGGCTQGVGFGATTGAFGQTVLKNGIRYVIFSTPVKIDASTVQLSATMNYARRFDVGSEIVFGGAVLTKGSNKPVFF